MGKTRQNHIRAGAFALALAAAAGQNAAAEAGKPAFFGRWTVDDPTDKFSPNGKLYRVFDVAACGKDFCGVSVEGGACGATLFRFLSIHAANTELEGHGKWGADKKKLWITSGAEKTALTLTLGAENFHPDSRMGMPTFTAEYHRIGDAQCKADAMGV